MKPRRSPGKDSSRPRPEWDLVRKRPAHVKKHEMLQLNDSLARDTNDPLPGLNQELLPNLAGKTEPSERDQSRNKQNLASQASNKDPKNSQKDRPQSKKNIDPKKSGNASVGP